MTSKKNILIVDDEIDICKLISGVLEDEGYKTFNSQNSDAALLVIKENSIDLVILDVWLEGSKLDGIELLQEINKFYPKIPIVIISGHGNIDTAVTAIKIGAYDYLEKPFKTERLIHVIKRATETYELKNEITEIKNKSNFASEYIGISNHVIQLRQGINKLAQTNSRILITGSIGVGKQLVSRLIHNKSNRSKNLFVEIDANYFNASKMKEFLSKNNMSEKKFFDDLNGGTLFINEISNMDMDAQRILLNIINGKSSVSSDFRMIASTSKDLKSYISLGMFSDELFNRISIDRLHIPSLLDRKEDIPILMDYFLENAFSVSEDSVAIFQSYAWPGNIKELKNVIDNIILRLNSDGKDIITSDYIPIEIKENNPNVSNSEVLISYNMKEARDIFERNYIISQLARFNGNISRTADFIGMERTALHRKLKYLGIEK